MSQEGNLAKKILYPSYQNIATKDIEKLATPMFDDLADKISGVAEVFDKCEVLAQDKENVERHIRRAEMDKKNLNNTATIIGRKYQGYTEEQKRKLIREADKGYEKAKEIVAKREKGLEFEYDQKFFDIYDSVGDFVKSSSGYMEYSRLPVHGKLKPKPFSTGKASFIIQDGFKVADANDVDIGGKRQEKIIFEKKQEKKKRGESVDDIIATPYLDIKMDSLVKFRKRDDVGNILPGEAEVNSLNKNEIQAVDRLIERRTADLAPVRIEINEDLLEKVNSGNSNYFISAVEFDPRKQQIKIEEFDVLSSEPRRLSKSKDYIIDYKTLIEISGKEGSAKTEEEMKFRDFLGSLARVFSNLK